MTFLGLVLVGSSETVPVDVYVFCYTVDIAFLYLRCKWSINTSVHTCFTTRDCTVGSESVYLRVFHNRLLMAF